jgi:hypothetical protein
LIIQYPLLKMKPLATSLLLVLGVSAFLQAEDPLPPATGTYAPGTLEVPAFTPPLPVVPKEPLPDAETTIVCRDDKGETVTLQRGDASMAPDLPAPEPLPDPALVQRFEDHRPRNLMINMSATVYNHKVTAVKWQHPVTQEPYEAVLGFDLGLVAHLGSFVFEGKPCHSNIFCMHMDTESPTARRAAARRLPPVAVPFVEADGYRITKGNTQDTSGVEPLLAVHGIYLAEKPRLQKLSADLRDYQQEAKAWADAHPAPAEPPVFWFKPHRNSRYLTPGDKAEQEQAAAERAVEARKGEAP